MTRDEAAEYFEARLAPVLAQVVQRIAVEAGLPNDVAVEFESFVRERLAADNFAILQRIESETRAEATLGIILRYLYRDRYGRLPHRLPVRPPPPTAHDAIIGSGVPRHPDAPTPLANQVARVTSAGATIGTVYFPSMLGLQFGALDPAPAYDAITYATREMGNWLARPRYWSADAGDLTEYLFSRWVGPTLGLEDEHRRAIPVGIVLIADTSHIRRTGASIVVIADFRTDAASVEAFLRTLDRPDGGWQSPP